MEPLSRTLTVVSADETFELGKRLGQVLEPLDFVGLDGQLGAGKTQFSRGVAFGLGVPLEDVSSPTYSIVQSYHGRVTLHHLDLYRLASEADLVSVGYFELLDEPAAMLVEWVSQVPSARPVDALMLRFDVVSDEARRVVVEARGPRAEALLVRWLDRAG
jgi:tRNA threonylcarbamoyladenosine biosynthesis protein TsaE